MDSIFFQLLDVSAKGEALAELCQADPLALLQSGRVFLKRPQDFSLIDGSPFTYWVSEELLQHIRKFKIFDKEDAGRGTRCGLGTLDDFQFLRLRWEADSEAINSVWKTYLHGGIYSPIFDEFPLVVKWENNGAQVKAFVESKVGSASRKVQGEDRYFRGGFVFPRRTRAFSPKIMPGDAIFSTAGQCGFATEKDLLWTTALMSSITVGYILSLSQGATAKGGGPSPQFEVGLIKRLSWPEPSASDREKLASLVSEIYYKKRSVSSSIEPSVWFISPAVFAQNLTLREAIGSWVLKVGRTRSDVRTAREKIHYIADQLYGLKSGQWELLLVDLIGVNDSESSDYSKKQAAKADPFSDGLLDYNSTFEVSTLCEGLMSFLLGCCYGRWDIRYATGQKAAPELPNPFAPLPVCPPGMLQNARGLPLSKDEVGGIKDKGKWSYAIEIPWDGILVDDPNHPLDIERCVREVIEIIWMDRAEAIEHEACEILGVRSVRDYFRKPAGFFVDHLSRYSKSRRQAPIYWPLSTASGGYTLWIYYHRLNENTLHTALADFIDPKLKSVREEISHLRNNGGQEVRLEERRDFEQELQEFRNEIERIIKLPWKPNLNDGVLITASPLWKLFRLPKWQKDLKACWEELSDGDYDWAHLAYTMWPNRVKEACKTDRSIAIAHGLEHLCKAEVPKPKKKHKKELDATFEELES